MLRRDARFQGSRRELIAFACVVSANDGLTPRFGLGNPNGGNS
jgi:hypothetical protein